MSQQGANIPTLSQIDPGELRQDESFVVAHWRQTNDKRYVLSYDVYIVSKIDDTEIHASYTLLHPLESAAKILLSIGDLQTAQKNGVMVAYADVFREWNKKRRHPR